MELDADLIVPDKSLSLSEGAIEAWRKTGHKMAIYYAYVLREFAHNFGVSLETPFYQLPDEKKRILLYGNEQEDGRDFIGVIPDLERRFYKTESEAIKRRIHSYMSELPCPVCKGARLKPEPLAVKLGGKNIHQIIQLSVKEASQFFQKLSLTPEQAIIGKSALKEISSRLSFLMDVGLSYLTLDRRSETLAGGEAQRIRLASQVGSGLVGVCYVLDEPTIGLHQYDNQKLLHTLRKLRNLGNTVVVVEHDEDTIRTSDYLIDIGPGAGNRGGKVIISGETKGILNGRDVVHLPEPSLTLGYLSGRLRIDLPSKRRFSHQLYQPPDIATESPDPNWLSVIEAREFNLKKINVFFPLGCFICVTGVSGSGKSTLVNEVLYKGLLRRLYKSRIHSGRCTSILGYEKINKCIIIDQSPIGRTPRSNPATYTGVFDEIRKVFAYTKEARLRGYTASRFSFNLKAGRCAACLGQGTKLIEMHFLPDVYITCEQCKGKRYNRETLDITYKGKNIAEVLAMEVSQALEFFQNLPQIVRILKTLEDVGLGYLALGQSSTTLSGGEAQRIKLAAELTPLRHDYKTLYILDEPTTGLHFSDINKLLSVLNQLVDRGNTVIVIEHNMHIIKMADYIIDLGPEGGDGGGYVIATGTPEEIAKNERSYTGKTIRKYLILNPA
jgi:excinuclease ABC subunit A